MISSGSNNLYLSVCPFIWMSDHNSGTLDCFVSNFYWATPQEYSQLGSKVLSFIWKTEFAGKTWFP